MNFFLFFGHRLGSALGGSKIYYLYPGSGLMVSGIDLRLTLYSLKYFCLCSRSTARCTLASTHPSTNECVCKHVIRCTKKHVPRFIILEALNTLLKNWDIFVKIHILNIFDRKNVYWSEVTLNIYFTYFVDGCYICECFVKFLEDLCKTLSTLLTCFASIKKITLNVPLQNR